MELYLFIRDRSYFTDMLRIRKMLREDIPVMLKIEKECFSVPWTEPMFLQEINQQYAFVAELDEQLVGFICGWKLADEFHITNIAVKPSHQNNKLGEHLLHYVLKQIGDSEFSFVLLEVRKANVQARGFYKKHGFKEIGVRKNYYSDPKEDAIIMSRKVSKIINCNIPI